MSGARGFHSGELLVQHKAGLVEEAARLEGMLANSSLDGRSATFLARRTFAVLTARDPDGRLWTVPVVGAPGFLHGAGSTLDIRAARPGPLARIAVGSPVGLITLDWAIRRRMRINGTVSAVDPEALRIDVHEAFGNCPSYIQARALEVTGTTRSEVPSVIGVGLEPADRALIESSDTFFLGSVHPERDADTSHKGGRPGFVRVDTDGSIRWPDYSGNNMFNSLGNLVEEPAAALLFLDFTTGATLHLSGTAEIEWTETGAPGDDDGTGRRVRFRPAAVVRSSVPVRAGAPDPSPSNPQLSAS